MSARKLQTAVFDDTGVELGLELLADVVREGWLVANGSPYPGKDSIRNTARTQFNNFWPVRRCKCKQATKFVVLTFSGRTVYEPLH